MIDLIPLDDDYTIYQLGINQTIPSQIFDSGFYSITRTDDEVSIVTNSKPDLEDIKYSRNWKGFKVRGILDFSLVGILNDLIKPLKDNNISVFVISTFNTDYIFVQEESFARAVTIFKSTDNIVVK
jgi:hypothetical protein